MSARSPRYLAAREASAADSAARAARERASLIARYVASDVDRSYAEWQRIIERVDALAIRARQRSAVAARYARARQRAERIAEAA